MTATARPTKIVAGESVHYETLLASLSRNSGAPTAAREADRRTKRTRAALRNALLELMTEKGWDGVSVQEICHRADVGRSTFYAHFPGKEDLLAAGLDDLRMRLERTSAENAGGSRPTLSASLYGLLEHVGDERALFRSVIGRRSAYIVQQRFRGMVRQLVLGGLPPQISKDSRQATAHWLAGGVVELLIWWVNQKSPVEPAELARLLEELAGPRLLQRNW